MNSSKVNRVFGLDFLRAIAISLVVFSHTTLLVAPNSNNFVITFIKTLGAVGVDLFFILSGFLIGGILLKQIDLKKTSFNNLIIFWKRRWLRTLPNYFLVLILNILVIILFSKDLPNRLWKYFLFIQNFNSPHPDFFTEAWSLSIEEYAYLLLPFVLFFSFKIFRKTDKKKLFFLMSLFSVLALLFIKILYFFNTEINSFLDWSSSFRKVVIYRIDSIYIGFLLVFLMNKFSDFAEKYKQQFLFVGLFLFISTHVVILIFNITPQADLGFYTFGYLQLVILSLSLFFPYFSRLNYSGIFKRSIQFISIHSYSIYLVNYSIVLLSIEVFFDVSAMSIFKKIGVVVLFLGSTILLSVIMYRYFEAPILKFRDKKYMR